MFRDLITVYLGYQIVLGLLELGEEGALLDIDLRDLGTEDAPALLHVDRLHPATPESDKKKPADAGGTKKGKRVRKTNPNRTYV